MIKLIGFDLDDTLWDLLPVIINAEAALDSWLKKEVKKLKYSVVEMRTFRHDLLIEEPQLKDQITEFRRRLIVRAMLESGLSRNEADALSIDAIEVFLKARNQITLFEGAESVLQDLGKNFQVCALSNGNADIKRLNIHHLFHFAYSAEQVGASKPAPQIFEAALSHTNVKAHEMIYVGDDPELDVDASKALGIHAIWMDRGKKSPSKFKADQVINNIQDLPSAIEKIREQNT